MRRLARGAPPLARGTPGYVVLPRAARRAGAGLRDYSSRQPPRRSPSPGGSGVCGEPRGCAAGEMRARQLRPGGSRRLAGPQVRGRRARAAAVGAGSGRAGVGVRGGGGRARRAGEGRGRTRKVPAAAGAAVSPPTPARALPRGACGGRGWVVGAPAAPLPRGAGKGGKRRRGGSSALARGCPGVGATGRGHIISGERRRGELCRQGRVARRGFKPGRDGTGRDGRLPAASPDGAA